MTTDPTPAEIQAGAAAITAALGGRPWRTLTPRRAASTALRAVLPDRDARIRAQVAEQIAQAIEMYNPRVAAIARAHGVEVGPDDT